MTFNFIPALPPGLQAPSEDDEEDFNVVGDEIFATFSPWASWLSDGNPFAPTALPTLSALAGGSAVGLGDPASVAAVTSGGITINVIYSAAAMAAPASFRAGIQQAVSILAAAISDKITVNIKIDYSGTGHGAAAGPDHGLYQSYSSIRADLINNAAPGDTTFNTLTAGSSVQGQSTVAVWNAQLKLWGLMAANDTTTDDGAATFATDIAPNLLVGVALHELTHAMGRVPFGTPNSTSPDIFDLFRFTSAGTRLFQGGATAPAAYFSVDGGNTKVADYGRTSDASDFLNSGVQGSNDPFNEFYNGGTSQQLTAADLKQLDALGFHLLVGDTTSPSLVHDGSITLAVGAMATIPSSQLQFDDNVSTHAQETYAVVTGPTHGSLLKSGSAATSFTQADIDNGLISYQQDGSVTSSDSFAFKVIDAAGNATNTASFQINISPLTGSVSINDVTITEGNSGTQIATFTVTRSGGTAAFAVDFATSDGTATTADNDYVANAGTLNFGAGVNTQTISVTINGDTKFEPDETFSVNLSAATNGATISDNSGIGTIANDDAAPAGSVSIDDVTITEGDGGTKVATFTVTRSGGTAAFAVDFATSDGTATTADNDYVANAGTLNFGAGVDTQTISVTINGDTKFESDETFSVNLSAATNGATISDNSGIGTIANDDAAPAGSVSIDDVTITEGDGGTKVATFTVTRSGGTAAFAVDFATSDGTATTADNDYAANAGTLNFGAGVDTQTISVTINGDTKVESDEAFFVALSSATNGATLASSLGTGTITNDDVFNPGLVHDFNGDTKSDLLLLNDTNHGVAVWEMNGTQVITSPQVGTVNAAAGWHYQASGDFNGDGKTDLLLLNDTTHGVAIWEMNGTRIIANPQVGTITAAAGWHFQATCDFNGDGKTDLLFLNDTTHGVAVWEMDGTRIIASPQVGTVNAADGWHFQATGDFNGDGKTDLLFLNDTTHGVAVWEMDGTRIIANPQVGTVNAAAGWHFQATGDFNGDGKTDLLLLNDTNHGVAVWEMDGTRIITSPQVGTVNAAAGWHFQDVGDFNGDGKSDLLLLNDTNHGVAVWEMDGTRIITSPQVGIINAAAGWHHDGLRDFNGDGKTDLLLENDTTHGVAVWLMDGTQVIASPQIGTINAADGWHMIV
jgi:hypothetical protein